ncbi:FMRFamide receptor-like [Aplysia californica]|uniref:FMRFamide receptor-like n=1 Tax=Aplysia californica TaxID=6500 RepID=A0ABM1VV84_APLCA|nr:FMRFamide receptor-like [Aplysia californica]
MTEIFTPGPYECGYHDPTTDYYRPPEVPSEKLDFYCAVRNIYGVLTTLIASAGILGNVVSLVILPRTGGARSAIILLFGLGVYDTVFLFSGIFLRYLPSISAAGHSAVLLANALSPIMFPAIQLSHFGAAYTTIAISIERCIAVTTPFKVFRWLTTKRVKAKK